MAGPSTRGGMRGRKKAKMRPSESGGQIYMSDDYAKKFKNSEGGNTELQELIEEKMTERMLAGEITPKETGRMNADIFIDQVYEANRPKRKNPVRKAEGGAVKGYMGGGKVRGYKDGGGVCRGGGAAVSGTKFRGVK